MEGPGLITTILLDPWIELTMRVPAMRMDGGIVSDASDLRVCGRAVNIAVTLRAVGAPTFATGLSCDGNHALLADLFERYGICQRFSLSHGFIRTDLRLLPEQGEPLVVHSAGDAVEPVAVECYLKRLHTQAQHGGVIVFSGALPAGAGTNLYRRSLAAVRGCGCKTVLAVTGKPLREALSRRPDLVVLDMPGLYATFRGKPKTRAELIAACRRVMERGAGSVCLSLEAEGALYVTPEAVHFAALPAQGWNHGAMDALVAGLCRGLWQSDAPGDVLLCAAAAAAAFLRQGEALRWHEYERLRANAHVERVDWPQAPGANPRKGGQTVAAQLRDDTFKKD